jgi:hypothetical protein
VYEVMRSGWIRQPAGNGDKLTLLAMLGLPQYSYSNKYLLQLLPVTPRQGAREVCSICGTQTMQISYLPALCNNRPHMFHERAS